MFVLAWGGSGTRLEGLVDGKPGFDQRRTPTFDMVFKVLKALGYRMEILALPEKRRRAAA